MVLREELDPDTRPISERGQCQCASLRMLDEVRGEFTDDESDLFAVLLRKTESPSQGFGGASRWRDRADVSDLDDVLRLLQHGDISQRTDSAWSCPGISLMPVP